MLFGSSYYIFPVAGGVAYFVWQLPINIRAGPELEFNWSILPINISSCTTS
jgi:hypothetical protein